MILSKKDVFVGQGFFYNFVGDGVCDRCLQYGSDGSYQYQTSTIMY